MSGPLLHSGGLALPGFGLGASSALASAWALATTSSAGFAGIGSGPAASLAAAWSRSALADASAYRADQSGAGGKSMTTGLAACGRACVAIFGPSTASTLPSCVSGRENGLLGAKSAGLNPWTVLHPATPGLIRRDQICRRLAAA